MQQHVATSFLNQRGRDPFLAPFSTARLKDSRSGKLLRGKLEGLRSVRVSRLRLIYRIGHGRQIEIVALGPRGRIYEETLRLVKKDQGVYHLN